MSRYSRHLVLLTLSIVFASLAAHAQRTISGTVTDATTGEQILGASVVPVKDGRGTSTNIYGFFSLTLSGDEQAIRGFLDLIDDHLVHSRVAMYQAHRGLLWIGEIARARELHDQLVGSNLSGSQRAHVRLRQLCAEGNVDEAQRLYDEAKVEFADRRSFPWLAANTMGYPAQGMESLRQFDADKNFNALAGFLLYGTFDPRPFPNLMAHLEIHGNETGVLPVLPYRCLRN